MDVRITRTKKMLEDALLDLMKTKPVEKITPTELCRKATVNRNTFYTHYSSVIELYNEVENKLINSVDESLHESDTTVEAITVICRTLKSNKMISDIIFSKHFSSKIMNRVFVMTDKFNMNKMNSENSKLSGSFKQMVSAYTIMGSAAVLECWVKNGMKESPEEVAEFIYMISKTGSSGAMRQLI